MKLPWTTLDTPSNSTAWFGKRLSASPRNVLESAFNLNPMVLPLVEEPFNSMTGLLVKPGWVVPSIVTGLVIAGNAAEGVIVKGGLPLI